MNNIIQEPGRPLPVIAQWDVIVCGGGPAGIAAAISAARNGAKTCLIETHGCLGGIWTSGSLSYILDARNKQGLLTEILTRLDALEGRQQFVTDVEKTKLVLEQMCLEAGVHVRLHTRVVAAIRDDRRLTHIITESKSGREAWSAQLFIDTTGDGDLGAQAGCSFSVGQEGTGDTQPMSLIALLTGVDPEQTQQFHKIQKDSRRNLLAEIQRGGFSPSYHSPGLWHIRDQLYILMANHEYRSSALSAEDITQATLRARAEIHRIVEALRSLGGVWSKLQLVSTGAQIGVREGRRLHGRYEVTIDDIVGEKRHEDAICDVTFGIDVHSPRPEHSKGFSTANDQYRGTFKSYDIPLRALIARDVDGLLMAGRCISGDFLAHSSYRVTGNAVIMGQAAGVAAAESVKRNKLPQELNWAEISRHFVQPVS